MLVPIFAAISSIFIYQLNGKKEVLKLDLVQFFYAFILSPVLFVWLKSIIYVLLRSEMRITLNPSQLFLVDTAFSTIFLYIFAFVVMHSLTKSFSLKRGHDPLYDVFRHSEYFHLWITHLVIHLGILLVFNLVALINIFVPFELEITRAVFRVSAGSGVLGGILLFTSMWLSDPNQQKANYMRVIKLAAGILFLSNVVGYFIFDVPFAPQYSFYWWNSFALAAFVSLSLFAYKSERAQNLFERVTSRLKHHKWDFRTQLFE